jgi:hypothetical protein
VASSSSVSGRIRQRGNSFDVDIGRSSAIAAKFVLYGPIQTILHGPPLSDRMDDLAAASSELISKSREDASISQSTPATNK